MSSKSYKMEFIKLFGADKTSSIMKESTKYKWHIFYKDWKMDKVIVNLQMLSPTIINRLISWYQCHLNIKAQKGSTST